LVVRQQKPDLPVCRERHAGSGYGDAAKPVAGVIDEDGLEVSRIYQADAATG
jgi:hypothetical protein